MRPMPGMLRLGATPADTSASVSTGPLAFRNSVRSKSKNAAPLPIAKTLSRAVHVGRQDLEHGLDRLAGDHVVPAGGNLAVGPDEEHPRLVDGVVPVQPFEGGLVGLLLLEVLPDLDVDEGGPVAVRLGQLVDHVGDRAAETA